MIQISDEKGAVQQVPVAIDLSHRSWRVGRGLFPETWIPASVPGNVQEDLWRAGLKPDPYIGDNAAAYEDTEGEYWTYMLSFEMPASKNQSNWDVVFDGVDYKAEFFLNGHWLGMHEGMFGEVVFPAGKHLIEGQNELCVVIHPLNLAPMESRAVIDPHS